MAVSSPESLSAQSIAHQRSQVLVGFVFAVLSAALFAIRPIFVKLVYQQGVDSETLMLLRMLFSAPIYALLLWYFLRTQQQRQPLNLIIVLRISAVGLLGYYGASFFDLLGLQYVTAQLGRMVLYSYPTLVVVFGALLFGKPFTTRIVVSLLITYLGVAVIFTYDLNSFGEDVIIGSALITVAAVLFALYLLFSKSLIDTVGSQVFTCIALLAASLGIIVHFSLTHHVSDVAAVNDRGLWLIVIIALMCTVIPTFFTTAAVARIGADKTSITSMIGPGFTSVFAVLLLGESFTVFHLLGIAFIVMGVFVLQKS